MYTPTYPDFTKYYMKNMGVYIIHVNTPNNVYAYIPYFHQILHEEHGGIYYTC